MLEVHGYEMHSTHLVNHRYGSTGDDFLDAPDAPTRRIATNPPFGNRLADAFLRHAMKLTAKSGGKVAIQ